MVSVYVVLLINSKDVVIILVCILGNFVVDIFIYNLYENFLVFRDCFFLMVINELRD